MNWIWARLALFVLDLSVAASAIGGGIAIVAQRDQFPPEWLASTPFHDYLIPGLILAVIVGGSAALAALLVFWRVGAGAPLSVLAGLVMMGWITGELILLQQNSASTSPRSPIEAIYFVLGLAMVVVGVVVWRSTRLLR